MNQNEFNEQYMKEFSGGMFNKLVRVWFYLQAGIDVINQFKYVVLGIFGIYVALKFTSYFWLLGMFAICLPILTIAGWVYINKMARNLSLTSLLKSSFFGSMDIDLNKKQVELLTEILTQLRKNNNPVFSINAKGICNDECTVAKCNCNPETGSDILCPIHSHVK